MVLNVEVRRRRFTLDEYRRMGEAGILHEDDRVELIHGEIVQMTPIGQPHAACVALLVQLVARRVGDRAVVWPQNPVTIPPDSELQPDVVLLRPRADFYRNARAGPGDVLLLVEVADASLRYDRNIKLPLYARAGLRKVWIVDVEADAVEVYREPTLEGYRRSDGITRGDRLSPEAFPDLVVTMPDILG